MTLIEYLKKIERAGGLVSAGNLGLAKSFLDKVITQEEKEFVREWITFAEAEEKFSNFLKTKGFQ